jgi:hypothetical protein
MHSVTVIRTIEDEYNYYNTHYNNVKEQLHKTFLFNIIKRNSLKMFKHELEDKLKEISERLNKKYERESYSNS